MASDIEVHAAQQQIRETLISAGIALARRIKQLRSDGDVFYIGMSVSGGLAVVLSGDPAVLRFGSPAHGALAPMTQHDVDRWNRQHPEHPIERVLVGPALERECFRVWALLDELTASIERTQS